jgi:hypothetical protein
VSYCLNIVAAIVTLGVSNALRFEPGQQLCDHSELVVRVFHMKVEEFITNIQEGKTFGLIHAGKTP